MVEMHRLQSRCFPTQQTNTKQTCSQVARSSRWHAESSHHVNEDDLSSGSSPTWLEPAYPSTNQSQPNEATNSTIGK